jgi:hypothetical protein
MRYRALSGVIGRAERARREERGQVLLLWVAMFTVLLAMAAMTIDRGLWLGGRREAQKTADAAARGGALVYVGNPGLAPGGSGCNDASQQAAHIAQHNGASVPNPDSCTGTDPNTKFTASETCPASSGNVPSITAQINRGEPALFSRAFGISGIDTGATAVACVGEPSVVSGVDPFVVINNAGKRVEGGLACRFSSPLPDAEPVPGILCELGPIQVESGDGPLASSGYLDLSGASASCADKSGFRNQLASGTSSTCKVGDTIPLLTDDEDLRSDFISGMCARIPGCSNAPRCPGGDGFAKVFSAVDGSTPVQGSQMVLVPNDCGGAPSRRILHVVVGSCADGDACKSVTVERFATFYVLACNDTGLDSNGNPWPIHNVDCHNDGDDNVVEGFFVPALIPNGSAPLMPPGSSPMSLSIATVQ